MFCLVSTTTKKELDQTLNTKGTHQCIELFLLWVVGGCFDVYCFFFVCCALTGPKMCANDPNDQMIAEASSLKEGVTNEIMKRAVDNQYTWATDTTRTLPLWLEVDEGDEEDEEDEGREHLDPATVLVGTFNALKSLLQASAVRDQALIGQVLRDVYNCDGRQNKTLGKCAFSTSVHTSNFGC
jgi:hypothetical protein